MAVKWKKKLIASSHLSFFLSLTHNMSLPSADDGYYDTQRSFFVFAMLHHALVNQSSSLIFRGDGVSSPPYLPIPANENKMLLGQKGVAFFPSKKETTNFIMDVKKNPNHTPHTHKQKTKLYDIW